MSISIPVIIEPFAERHFISRFQKKYKRAWEVTWTSVCEEFKRIDSLLGVTSLATVIAEQGGVRICKTEFRVHGTNISRHASGNRCIVAVEKQPARVSVLLVYHKNDLGSQNETAAWKQLIKQHYLHYSHLL